MTKRTRKRFNLIATLLIAFAVSAALGQGIEMASLEWRSPSSFLDVRSFEINDTYAGAGIVSGVFVRTASDRYVGEVDMNLILVSGTGEQINHTMLHVLFLEGETSVNIKCATPPLSAGEYQYIGLILLKVDRGVEKRIKFESNVFRVR